MKRNNAPKVAAATDSKIYTKKVSVVKEFHFCAAHHLPGYDGPCNRIHGHNYRVQVRVTGPVDPQTGMVIDFAKLKEVVAPLLSAIDHRMLNMIDLAPDFPTGMPTAENVALWILDRANVSLTKTNCRVTMVRLWETDGSYAEVEEEQIW